MNNKKHIDQIESDTFVLPFSVTSTEQLKDGWIREFLVYSPPIESLKINLDDLCYTFMYLSRYVKGSKIIHAVSFYDSPVEHPTGVVNENIRTHLLATLRAALVKGWGLYDILPEAIQKKLDEPGDFERQAMVERMAKARAARGKAEENGEPSEETNENEDGDIVEKKTSSSTSEGGKRRGRAPLPENIGFPKTAICVNCKAEVIIVPDNIRAKAKVLGISVEECLANYRCRKKECGGRLPRGTYSKK